MLGDQHGMRASELTSAFNCHPLLLKINIIALYAWEVTRQFISTLHSASRITSDLSESSRDTIDALPVSRCLYRRFSLKRNVHFDRSCQPRTRSDEETAARIG